MSPTPRRTMDQFKDQNGKFKGPGREVHEVALQPWVDGMHVPGPACRTPSATFDPEDFEPVKAKVSCQRCRPDSAADQPATPTPVDENQLDLLADVPHCSNGCDQPCICDHPDDCWCGCADDHLQDDTDEDEDERCDDLACPNCYPDQPCPVDCACAWCRPPRVVTRRPDPAYL